MMVNLCGVRAPREAKEFLRWLVLLASPAKHDLTIEFSDEIITGMCLVKDKPSPLPYLLVTVGPGLLDAIAHEYVHYEQWRDGKPMTERGVRQRAAALVRRWRRERT